MPSFTIDIPEEKALKMSEREQQVERLQHQLSSVELTKFCEFLKAKTSTSAVFVFKGVPLGVDVVFNEEKTVVTMYGQWEEAPKNLVRMARTCVQRRGWLVLNGANAVSTAGLMSLMAIVGSLVIGLVAAGSGGGCDDPTFDPGEGNGFQQMLSWPMRFLILNSNGSCNRGRLAKTGVSFFVLFWMTIVFGLIDSKIQAYRAHFPS